MNPTYDLQELLSRVKEASENQIGFKRRIGEIDEAWKDPIECMKRLQINRFDAVTIVKNLRASDCYKGPVEAWNDAHPSPKFSFKTTKPEDLTGGTELYIKLSSPDKVFKVFVDSFHESERPEGCYDDGDW